MSNSQFLLIVLEKQLIKILNSSLNTIHSAHNLGFIFDKHLIFSDQILLFVICVPILACLSCGYLAKLPITEKMKIKNCRSLLSYIGTHRVLQFDVVLYCQSCTCLFY